MRKITSLLTGCLVVLCGLISCSRLSAPADAIGTEQKQFDEVLGKLKKEAGVENPEYMSLMGSYMYSPTSNTRDGSSSTLRAELVSGKDNNKIMSYLYVIPGDRILEQEVTLSVDNKEIARYEEFEFALMKESEISNLLGNMAGLLKQAEEKSEYGADAYIGLWKIERDDEGEIRLDITVQSKAGLTLSQIYRVDAAGNFIK